MPIALLLTSPILLSAQNLRLGAGLSTTYDNLNAFFNASNYATSGGARQLLSDTPYLSYHFAARYMLSLGENVGFTASASWYRFGDTRVNVVDPAKPSVTLSSFQASQIMVPIAGGLEYTIFRLGVGLYVMGELSYNYFSTSAETFPTDLTLKDRFSRVGANAGIGADLSLGGVGADLVVRYQYVNLIGKEAGEKDNTFISLTLSLILGKK